MEVTHVLHRVCENVLRDPTASEQVLVNRAKVSPSLLSSSHPILTIIHPPPHPQGLLLCGAIFKATKAEESDAERRELEMLVAEAAAGKSKAKELRKKAFDESQRKAMEERTATAGTSSKISIKAGASTSHGAAGAGATKA
jgi:hypothetical protein